MKIVRRRQRRGGQFHSTIQLVASVEEVTFLRNARLMDMKIQMKPGSLLGKKLGVTELAGALKVYVNRIRNRWSVAVVRTSGSILIDNIILSIKALLEVIELAYRAVFGTRKTVRTLLRGIHVASKRVEDVKEAETFIFISVAALHQAVLFAKDGDREDTFEGDSFWREVAGLSFAGTALGTASSGGARGGGAPPRGFEEDQDEDDVFEDETDTADAGSDMPDVEV